MLNACAIAILASSEGSWSPFKNSCYTEAFSPSPKKAEYKGLSQISSNA